jgi:hypothetical protein
MATATEITNLDELIGEPRQVEIGGEVYELPADIPAELFLKIASYEGEPLSGAFLLELKDELLELFQEYQPEMDTLPGTLMQMVVLIPTVYGSRRSAEDADPPKPKRKAAAGTRSTSRKRKGRSASSS